MFEFSLLASSPAHCLFPRDKRFTLSKKTENYSPLELLVGDSVDSESSAEQL